MLNLLHHGPRQVGKVNDITNINVVTCLRDQQEALARFDYIHNDGSLVYKKRDIKVLAGQIADTPASQNRLQVSFKRTKFLSHRVIWLLIFGYWPNEIDHIDHDPSNNRLTNLREVTRKEQQRNHKKRVDNTSGATGVSYHKQSSRWRAYLHEDGKMVSLGLYSNKEDAALARKNAEIKYNFHPNHGT